MNHSRSPLSMVTSLIEHRDLVWQMTKREVAGRYRGSVLGLAWSWFNPLIMLGAYTFVFSVVFRARWADARSDSQTSIALILFSGLIMHGLFAECASRAPMLILTNTNLVKKVVFPLDVLPWVTMGSALFHAFASLVVLLVVSFVETLSLPMTALLFPLIVFPLVWITMGVTWFLAATGVFLRDIGQAITLLTSLLLFLSPVFYPTSALPENYRPLIQLNPLTFVIEQSRNVLIWGRMPNWTGLALYTLVSLVVAYLGFWWFQKTRRGFADVL